MNYKHKNINEPMRILVMLGKDYSGESFTLTFSTGKDTALLHRHVCKFDAETGKYVSCEPVEGGSVLCSIPPRKVGVGILMLHKQVIVEDWSMVSGKQVFSDTSEVTVTINGREWGVEMTTAATDYFNPSTITTQLLPLFTRGKPGKTRWADLTEDEKAEVVTLLGTMSGVTPTAQNSNPIVTATTSTPGVVRIGEGLTVTAEGTLSIDWSFVRKKLLSSVGDTNMRTEL